MMMTERRDAATPHDVQAASVYLAAPLLFALSNDTALIY